MSGIDIAIITVVSVAFAAALGAIIYRKVKHKGCDCDCGGNCSHCSKCAKADTKKTDSQN